MQERPPNTPQDPSDPHDGFVRYPGQMTPRSEEPDTPKTRFMLVVLVVVLLAIAGVALLLSQANPGDQTTYTAITAENNAVALLRVVERADISGTMTRITEAEFTLEVPVDAIPADYAVAVDAAEIQNVPDGLLPLSPAYTVAQRGTPPERALVTLFLLEAVAPPLSADLFGLDAGSGDWRFIPSQMDASGSQLSANLPSSVTALAAFRVSDLQPFTITTLESGQSLPQDAALSIVAPTGLRPAPDPAASLAGNPAPGFNPGGAYEVMPTIRNYLDPVVPDSATVQALIHDPARRNAHAEQIAAVARSSGYDGVIVDYRGLTDEDREAFTAFVSLLGAALQADDLTLGVVLPYPQHDDAGWATGAYDWAELGHAAHLLIVDVPPDPTLFDAQNAAGVHALLDWATRRVDRRSLALTINALPVRQQGEQLTEVSVSQALAGLGDVTLIDAPGEVLTPGSEVRVGLDGLSAVPGLDAPLDTPFIDYLTADGERASRVWLTTAGSTAQRLATLSEYGVGGVFISRYLAEDVPPAVRDVLIRYRQGEAIDVASTTELGLRWRISHEDGEVQTFTAAFNEEITLTLAAPLGQYTIEVELVGGDLERTFDSQTVALAAPTATPTALPRPTITPTPTVTPTLMPVVPTTGAEALPPLLPANPAIPGAGSIQLSGFEYGGHVTSAASDRAANAMRNAGMTWMKVQVRFTVGTSTDYAAQTIANARERGFKILLGIVGDPDEVRGGGEAYIRSYAAFVGEVAALGPDAIEVWNEPNLGREWPAGQISGANFTALLAQAYNAIKARNPNVLVIAGAPAPTGAEAAFPGLVVNDDRFVTQMVNAGALNYMDCMGVHYNEGLVTGSARSGDPRDDYYTRYLPTLIDRYWSLIGGQRPLCITELGYLTAQGYGSLPGAFAWAGNMTVGQQAAYLADAASYSSRSGRVQLMIVWNVDFERFDEDPMAGYAIIRPDGSCPACSALAGAR